MASIPQAEFLLVALLSPFDDRYLAFSAYGNPPSFGWVDMAEDSLHVLARGVPMRLPIGWLRDSLSFFWQDSVVLQTSVRTNATDFAPHTLVGVGLSISEIAPISGHESIVLATPKEGSAQLYLVDEMTGTYRQLTNSRSHKSNLRLVATN
jgi:hypothetical protein